MLQLQMIVSFDLNQNNLSIPLPDTTSFSKVAAAYNFRFIHVLHSVSLVTLILIMLTVESTDNGLKWSHSGYKMDIKNIISDELTPCAALIL
jgi:hypothetical protein